MPGQFNPSPFLSQVEGMTEKETSQHRSSAIDTPPSHDAPMWQLGAGTGCGGVTSKITPTCPSGVPPSMLSVRF